ncbi:3710_t:CDS:1, partial [Acaulospora morrowiae]
KWETLQVLISIKKKETPLTSKYQLALLSHLLSITFNNTTTLSFQYHVSLHLFTQSYKNLSNNLNVRSQQNIEKETRLLAAISMRK